MKKILSLLILLIISGTAIPTTIAASSYKKQEKLNSNINSKTNNSENLNRSKRKNNNITPDVKVSYEINYYFSDLYNAINFLQNNDNIRLITTQETGGHISPSIFFVNKKSNNQYFIAPINIENDRRIILIFRSSDFCLQGFIGHSTSSNQNLNVYYYFNDSTITNVSGITISQIMPFGSNYTGYNGTRANERAPIRWILIVYAFNQLANYGKNPSFVYSDTLRAYFFRVILETAESIGFREVRNNIISNQDNDASTSNWDWYFNNFLTNWDRILEEELNNLIQLLPIVGFYQLQNINIFSKILLKYFKYYDIRNARYLNNNEYCFNLSEKIAYFRSDHGVSEYNVDWKRYTDDYDYVDFYEVKIGDIIPLNYNKIEFFGKQLTKMSLGNDAYFGKKIGDTDIGNNFKNYIYNLNIRDYPKSKYIEVAQFSLDDKCEKSGLAWMCHTQKVGITYYKNHKTKKWHIKIISYLKAQDGVAYSEGTSWIWVVNGIKLN